MSCKAESVEIDRLPVWDEACRMQSSKPSFCDWRIRSIDRSACDGQLRVVEDAHVLESLPAIAGRAVYCF